MNKEEYQEYLKSEHWKEKRQAALKHYGEWCALCNSKSDLQVHHNSYELLGDEDMGDLTILCKKCHASYHRKQEGVDLHFLTTIVSDMGRLIYEIACIELEEIVFADQLKKVAVEAIVEYIYRLIIKRIREAEGWPIEKASDE